MIADLFEWAGAARVRSGETELGDNWCALARPRGLRVAVVDGLGHGPLAADAARRAIEIVVKSLDEDQDAVLRRCHEGLRETRGVALSLVDLAAAAGTLTWAGVGNVSALLARHDGRRLRYQDALVTSPGILGRRAPILPARTISLHANDLVLLTTDGLRAEFQGTLPEFESLQDLADRLVRDFGNPADDVLAVVVRCRGSAS